MLPKEFRRTRIKKGYTQALLAEAMGYSLSHVQKYEQGQRPIPARAEKLLRAAPKCRKKCNPRVI